MFSLSFLFLTLPLYFSHIFTHFGVVIGDGASFERQKMYLFCFVICISLVEMLLVRYIAFLRLIQQYWYIIGGCIILPFIPMLFYGGQLDAYWIRGSYEKFHGYILYIGLIILTVCLSLLKAHERKRLIWLSFFPLIPVCLIAIFEGFGLQVFFPINSGVWGEGSRAISTLGNPNYLAGYLLMMLPLVNYIHIPQRHIISVVLMIALITTGSYIAIAIAGIYFLYYLTSTITQRYSLSNITSSLIFFSIIFGFLTVGYFHIPIDKFLSLSGRFVLMGQIAGQLIGDQFSIIMGYGPEAILRFFSETRTAIVDSYFPRDSIIDSSHNIILDFIFQYGIIPLIYVAVIIYKNWNIWNSDARASWMLGMLFLMFNPYVIVHLTLLTLTFSLHDDRK